MRFFQCHRSWNRGNTLSFNTPPRIEAIADSRKKLAFPDTKKNPVAHQLVMTAHNIHSELLELAP